MEVPDLRGRLDDQLPGLRRRRGRTGATPRSHHGHVPNVRLRVPITIRSSRRRPAPRRTHPAARPRRLPRRSRRPPAGGDRGGRRARRRTGSVRHPAPGPRGPHIVRGGRRGRCRPPGLCGARRCGPSRRTARYACTPPARTSPRPARRGVVRSPNPPWSPWRWARSWRCAPAARPGARLRPGTRWCRRPGAGGDDRRAAAGAPVPAAAAGPGPSGRTTANGSDPTDGRDSVTRRTGVGEGIRAGNGIRAGGETRAGGAPGASAR